MSSVETKINIAQGGTGADTAAGARTNLDVPQDPVAVANGGTGLTAVGTANQVLATNSGATGLEWQDAGSAQMDLVNSSITASDNLKVSSDANSGSDTSGAYVKVKDIRLGFGGGARVKFSMRVNDSGGYSAYGRIYVNGSPVGTERNNSSETPIEYSEDIGSLTAGDSVQVYAKGNTSGYPTSIISNFRIYYDKTEVEWAEYTVIQ